MRWIKKPERKDKLWFLAWPCEVKLGSNKERGMDTNHTLYIWGEWVRVEMDGDYESRARITTKDENGFDYYGNYFKKFKNTIHAIKWSSIWIGAACAFFGMVVLMTRLFR